MITEEAARADLEEHLRKQVRDEVWDYLVERFYVNEYLQGESDLKKLADEYRRLDALDRTKTRREHAPRELPPDNRSESLAEIIAIEASRIPEVQSFRKHRLRGRLLALEQWRAWFRRHAEKERPETIDAEALEKCIRFTLDTTGDHPGDRTGFRSSIPSVFVIAKPGGVVEDLLNTAFIVEEQFWPAIDLRRAFILVLTGVVWLPRMISEEQGNYDYPALSRIRLDIDPRVKPRELQEYYAELRDRALPSRGRVKDRVMTDKHLQLAAFNARLGDPRPPWAESLKQWNEEHPEWAYPVTRSGQSNFARDLKSAYDRVTGKIRQGQILKEGFKSRFVMQGKSAEEAEKLAEIAARERPQLTTEAAEDQGEA